MTHTSWFVVLVLWPFALALSAGGSSALGGVVMIFGSVMIWSIDGIGP